MLEGIAEAVRRRLPDRLVVTAHLDVVEPDIAAGIDACVKAGAEEIVVHPFFLAPGRHTTRDIPERVEAAADRHPSLRIHITPPLGPHDMLVDLILERVREARP